MKKTQKTPEIKITSRKINYETRYFAETDDGFDGTAQGYGYKSKQGLIKAHWYHLNRNKIKSKNAEAKKFLKNNSDVKAVLDDYYSERNYLYALKNGEKMSIKILVEDLLEEKFYENHKNQKEIGNKLIQVKELWTAILKIM